MPLRNDHEAALARASALERELKAERASDARQAERVARLEWELAEARVRLGRAESELSALRPVLSAVRPPFAPEPLPMSSEEPWREILRPLLHPVVGDPGLSSVPPVIQRSGSSPVVTAVAVGAGLALLLAIPAVLSHGSDEADEELGDPYSLAVDHLLKEGLSKIREPAVLTSIEMQNVESDGRLNAALGFIAISSTRPAPGHGRRAKTVDECPAPFWRAPHGWINVGDPCPFAADVPVGRPTCSVAAFLGMARRRGAPARSGRITVAWGDRAEDLLPAWIWTLRIDEFMKPDFVLEVGDRECRAAASGEPLVPP